jgi:tRNA (pseudouridine54-N1)-methyltransferase
MKAGRMDIVCHVIINALFISRHMREDVKLNLVFYGAPDPPKHLELNSEEIARKKLIQDDENRIDISKKDVAGLIKRMLFKYRQGRKTEVWPGYYVEKKNLFDLIKDLKKEGKTVYILDDKGEDIRDEKININNSVFLLGDHQGLPTKELKRLKRECKLISLGKRTYFASQVMTILNNELDRKEDYNP